ncbi:hypothetical protein QWZ13_10135 [Reinekea marina]|uniref:Uncharacterized protein n=1 Tax=Reinekea marina TaxID=1310421 RepID=A0ABV7WRV7_9GAMM|nr:hypothetical protein [Reinekea marina]MBU2862970.1 hypothetical protein [Reinekea forsetii]MDN3649271.1 hypothetical protein [Reinekea marina]
MDSTTTIIAVGIIAVFSMIIIAMMVSQARHRALESKNNRARSLVLQKKRLNNLLRTLPGNYLSAELRDFLYQAIIQNLKTQLTISTYKTEELQLEIDELTTERQQVKSRPVKAPSVLLTPDQTSIYRGLLKSLYQFVKGNYQTGRLNKAHAEKMLQQVEIKLDETAVEFFELSAKAFLKEKRYREAKNAYQKALSTIDESKHKDQFKQQQVVIQSSQNKLIEDWRESREESSKQSTAKLADQMEHMVDDQDSWKKKQSYD